MTRRLADQRRARPDPERARRDAGRRGRCRHRQDDRARQADPRRDRHPAWRSPTIVAVTFTEKAAGELKLRLREEHRAGAPRGGRIGRRRGAGRFEQRAPAPRRGARQHDPHALCGSAARAARRGARRSALRRADRGPGGSRLRRGLPDVAAAQLLAPREGVRRSLRRTARRNFGRDVDEDGPVERLRQAGLDAAAVARPSGGVVARARLGPRPRDRRAARRRSKSSRRSPPSPHRARRSGLQEPHRGSSARRRDRPGPPRGPARLRRVGGDARRPVRGIASSAQHKGGRQRVCARRLAGRRFSARASS